MHMNLNWEMIAWGFAFGMILAAAGVWDSLWRHIFKSKWTRFQVEKVEIVSSGYLCLVKLRGDQFSVSHFFDRDDVKAIEYQPGQGLRRTLVIKKATLKKRGLL